jgi:hypothetical protein
MTEQSNGGKRTIFCPFVYYLFHIGTNELSFGNLFDLDLKSHLYKKNSKSENHV